MELLLAALMVKDEEPRIIDTLKTTIDYIDLYVILDTGSSDNTIPTISSFLKKYHKNFRIYQSEFVDYASSRNLLLEYCTNLSKFILMLDSNDRVHNLPLLMNHLQKSDAEMFCVRMEIYHDVDGQDTIFPKLSVMRNSPFIRYQYPVHEQLVALRKGFKLDTSLQNSEFYISQDRRLDKDSTFRFVEDEKILKNYMDKNGIELIPCFYLCQTLCNLRKIDELREWAKILISFEQPKVFVDPIFMGYLYLGSIEENYMPYFLLAYEYGKRYCERAEPFALLAQQLFNDGFVKMAYFYIKKACKIEVPPKEKTVHCRIHYNIYEKDRWELLEKIENML